ncbi:thiol-activated cytolysin family protein [Porphyromonas sp. oral taxon 278]|uniref:thiol-activated cytolysin family protein n=1 Tax=Porphyromonas sp. oral taxon 278 TaxID=712437 RepID=UPI0025E10833|nr:thiol-activated cytolysin family protein [Porphyromonas sp. oral taxon 278]
MKKTTLALALLAGLCLASCDKTPNGGDTPNPNPGNKDPKNILEVGQLLSSAGRVAEAAEDKLTAKPIGSPTSEPAPKHTLESTGLTVDCDKVTQSMQYDFSSNSEDFAILDPWPSVLWPGCLIQGKTIRGKNVPATIPIISKRQPGRINLQIISGARSVGDDGEGLWYEEVQEMRESNVIQAQNRLIRRWQESGVPASTSFSMEVVHSAEEAIIASGLDIDKSWGKIKAFFSTGFDKRKSHVLVKLYQRFYTLNYEDPDGGFKGAFKPTIEQSDLAPYTGPGNPICYVSSVSYGRVYYLLFESSHEANALVGALSTNFKKIQAGLAVERSTVIDESRVKMIQRGGDAYGGLVAAISPEQVFKFIEDGALPSAKNVGAPVSFTVKHLYDALPVRMSNTLSYSYDKVTFVPRSKNNNVAILLRDIIVESSAKGRWEISNRGHVRILDASVSYDKVGDKRVHNKQYLLDSDAGDITARANLRSTAYLPVYGRTHYNCRPEGINLITFTVVLEIRPEAYRRGGRSGESNQRVTLTRIFQYDEADREWKALKDEPNTSGDAYRTLSAIRTFDNLTFNIRANFSFFADNTLIE